MQPGPTIIKKCSVCNKSIKQHTLLSGNTFGATFWTDGKQEAPMLPDQPCLVICPFCHAPLWIDELEKLGEIEYSENIPGKFNDAMEYERPTQDDYTALLIKGIVSQEKERYIRLQFWWVSNDSRRISTADIPVSTKEELNMIALAEMLDEEDANDLIMKAELLRELGRFEDARVLLSKSVDKDLRQAVKIINGLLRKSDRYVREMNFK